ncbi:MAG: SDR family NAD(P)-dependent oxidoreductase, partial [Exilibacterium sp.]
DDRVLIAKSDPQALVPGALQIFNPCPDGASGEFPATLWAWIRINQTGNGQSNHKYLDIDLFDDHLHDGKGKVRFQLEGLVLQPPETRTAVATNRKVPGKANTATDCLLFYPQWCERPAAENAPAPVYSRQGILKTARKEYPKFIGQLIGVEAGASADALAEKLQKSSRCPQDQEIEYRYGKRLVSTWAEWKSAGRAQREATSPWRKNGVYLITGDAGGPGLMYAKIYAKELARNASHPTIFLTGRREITSADSAALKALQSLGATVEYRQVDISDPAAVRALITSIQETGQLKGVIHCADVQRDNIILKKPTDEIAPVLAPKVRGLINLDTATRDIDLDFFVLFASTAGALGNTGQADYAAANAFMDAYAAHRNQQVKSRQRSGRTLSINWPLWAWDDTQANKTAEKKLQQEMGAVLLTLEAGIWAFYQSLCTDQPAPCFQVLVMEGEPEKIRSSLLPMTDTGATASESAPSPYDLLNPSGPEASSTAVSAQR